MKVFGNQILQDQILQFYNVPKIRTLSYLSCKEKIYTFEKSNISRQYIPHENLPVDILIESDFIWSTSENEIIRGEPGTAIAIVWIRITWASRQTSEFVELYADLSFIKM